MNKTETYAIAALATERVLGHLGSGEPTQPMADTMGDKFIDAIFGVEKTPEEVAAVKAAAAAAKRAAWDAKAAAERAERAALAAARVAELAAQRAAEDAPAIARVAMVNTAIATLVAEGVLAPHEYADQPHVWGLYWSERKRCVLDENSHHRSPEAWLLYESIKREGTTCPDRAADLLAEICGLLED
jgi:hypothetical protein